MAKQIERCCLCDEPTGRAGKSDDSIFLDLPGGTIGPLCEMCELNVQLEAMTERAEQAERERDRLAEMLASIDTKDGCPPGRSPANGCNQDHIACWQEWAQKGEERMPEKLIALTERDALRAELADYREAVAAIDRLVNDDDAEEQPSLSELPGQIERICEERMLALTALAVTTGEKEELQGAVAALDKRLAAEREKREKAERERDRAENSACPPGRILRSPECKSIMDCHLCWQIGAQKGEKDA